MKKEIQAFNCNTCNHCNNKHCKVFNRPVEVDYNRCKNHSRNNPFAKPFKVNNNLETIMKMEEEAQKKHYKGWLVEDEKLRKLIRADIEREKHERKSA